MILDTNQSVLGDTNLNNFTKKKIPEGQYYKVTFARRPVPDGHVSIFYKKIRFFHPFKKKKI